MHFNAKLLASVRVLSRNGPTVFWDWHSMEQQVSEGKGDIFNNNEEFFLMRGFLGSEGFLAS